MDHFLAKKLFGRDTQRLVLFQSSRAQAIWQPSECNAPGMHRCIAQVASMCRKYANTQPHPIHCIACRICHSNKVLWARHPTELEQEGYATVQRVFGTGYYCMYEWRPFTDTAKSVDLVVVCMVTFTAWAIHFDGKQHAHSRDADVQFDQRLLTDTCITYVVRLRQADKCKWPHVLHQAMHAKHGTCYYSWCM